MKKTTTLIAIILLLIGNVNAQFLKNLGNKIENAAEKSIEKKAEQKTTETVDDAFDETFNKEKNTSNNSSSSIEKTPNQTTTVTNVSASGTYIFYHRVGIEMTTDDNVMVADYFLPNSDQYFCIQIKDENIQDDFYTVFDAAKQTMFTFMETNGSKMQMGISVKDEEGSIQPGYTINATGKTKTILGYNCQEYYMVGEEMTGEIWVTKELNFRFPSNMYSAKQKKTNNQEWMNEIDGWAMETKIIDTSKKKAHTIIMKTTSIEGSSLSINAGDYAKLGFPTN